MILGSIEAGGTKFVCAVGNENYEVIDKAIFPRLTSNHDWQLYCILQKISGNAGE